MQTKTQSFQDLQSYQLAFRCSVDVYHLIQPFPDAERPLALKLLSTAHAVRAQIAAGWGQRRNREGLLIKLSAAQLAATEMQRWLEAAIAFGYLDAEAGQDLYDCYSTLYGALDQLMETAVAGTTQPAVASFEDDLPASA
ncbi:MAG: four helix bundle protein [Leptolyngbya sp. SIOISBB]|nr:four helix bundle protein [Leptolyngbya sp. SIOISBB]